MIRRPRIMHSQMHHKASYCYTVALIVLVRRIEFNEMGLIYCVFLKCVPRLIKVISSGFICTLRRIND